ncbi:hypothetical protein Ddye_016328, partial [Dipteronia dyeriana]
IKLVKDVSKDLVVLWEDGYGTESVKDYPDEAKEIIRPDRGNPCWFCLCLKVIFRFVSLIPLKTIISDIEIF